MISTGYRNPLYDGTTAAINPAPPTEINPPIIPSRRRPHQVDNARLITTLLDHGRYPASALVRLYPTSAGRSSPPTSPCGTLSWTGHVLRSGDRPGLEQEIWALPTLYQLLRMAMVTVVETRPGTDPDRASFTTAMEAARDQLTTARGVCPDGPADPLGVIGRAVLGTLLPARRPRYSARKVKCATSRYLNRDDDRPSTPTTITAINIAVRTPPLDLAPRHHRDPNTSPTPQPSTRRHRVMAIVSADPPHLERQGTRPAAPGQAHNFLTQLGEWTRLGFLTRTGAGTYALDTPP
jgi:hypothetical protein